jgi:RNA polymerase sigma-70 factor (ECF subfamily)
MVKNGFQHQLPKDLILLAKSGDMSALETIYSTYIDASYSLSYRMTFNSQLSEDIVQDAFVKVLKNISTFDFKGSLAGWVRKIIVNESINSMKSSHQINILLDNEIADRQHSDLFSDKWIFDLNELDYFLEKLPEMSRVIVLLHEIEGYKHQEIAEIFNKSESFSKMILKRAYSELHQLVKVQENNTCI